MSNDPNLLPLVGKLEMGKTYRTRKQVANFNARVRIEVRVADRYSGTVKYDSHVAVDGVRSDYWWDANGRYIGVGPTADCDLVAEWGGASPGACLHSWVDTGMKVSWCRHCNANGVYDSERGYTVDARRSA